MRPAHLPGVDTAHGESDFLLHANRRHHTLDVTPASGLRSEAPQPEWFEFPQHRNASDERFLVALRQAVLAMPEFAAVSAASSSAFPTGLPLTVGVEVPQVSADRRHLWVCYWVRPNGDQQLQGAWGGDYLLDDWTGDLQEELTVAGVEAPPEQFAEWTAGWFARQLRRPVYRDDWTRPRSYSIWRFGDSEEVLQSRRPLLAPKRPPERSFRER